MRVQTEEWQRFRPGIRMYKGKKTYFYNGEKLRDDENGWLIYDKEKRQSWEVIIVLPGVEIIPEDTFYECENVKVVIMSDTVRRIEEDAIRGCHSLVFVKLSTNLEFIGNYVFYDCHSLTSIFIPRSCREIARRAFCNCKKLIIFSVPQHTRLQLNVIVGTALFEASPFETNTWGSYSNTNEVNEWIRNRHADNEFSLHRACASYNPLDEVIFDIVRRQGPRGFKKPDSVGVTPSQYLSQNPFTEIKEHNIIKRYILAMTGEVV